MREDWARLASAFVLGLGLACLGWTCFGWSTGQVLPPVWLNPVSLGASALVAGLYVLHQWASGETATLDGEMKILGLIQALDDVYWIGDPADERLIYVSSNYEEIWGYPAARAVAEPRFWLRCLHPDDRKLVVDDIPQRRHRVGYQIEYRIVRPDGGVRWIEDRSNPIRDARGKLLRVAGVCRDITARKQAEAALGAATAALEAVVHNAPLAICLQRPDGIVTLWNPAAERLFGWSAAEAVGCFIPIAGEAYRAEADAIRARVLAGETQTELEAERLRRDGSRILFSFSNAPIRDASGAAIGVVTIAIDISQRKRMEAALRAGEEKLRGLLDAMPALVWMAAPDGHPAAFNRYWRDFTGGAADENLARAWRAALHPDDRARVLAQYGKAFAAGEAVMGEFRLRRADGEYRWMLDRGVPRRDAAGQLLGFAGVCLDITEQKLLEHDLAESRRRLDQAQQVGRIGSFTRSYDPAPGGPLRWSPMVYQIFGLPLGSEVDNDTFYRHVHPEDRERVRATVRASVESQSAHALDYRIVRPEGQQRWVTQRAEVVNDEQVGGRVLVGVVQDVTELRQTEQDLRTLQAALEQRVAERTAELVAAYGQLESFSYSVSHDLRAPLRHIAGYVALLEEEVRPVLNKQVRAYVQSIQSAVERMSELIDALLEFCRLHRAELVWEGVEHAALVQELRCELDVLEGGRRIHWDITELPASQGDARLLRSVWQNLLSNAIKYSARVEQPLISVTAVADEDYLRFSVRDNGVGFDLRYAGKLFRVFERLHSAAEFPGTGVGLAVVRRIVERHGGRVWAESAPGEGACFFFTLPRTSGALATDQTVSASQ